MKKSFLIVAVLGVLLRPNYAVADYGTTHTGLVDGNNVPITTEVNWNNESATTMAITHDESLGGNTTVFKGWWWISMKNLTNAAWAGMQIAPGSNDLVAISTGNNLEDEFGNSGTSVTCSRAGSSVSYADYIRNVTYASNGATADLYKSAYVTFGSTVTYGQSVLFKVYTDNSYYGTPAGQFQLTLTPTMIPEPGGLLALSAGVVSLLGFTRRRRS